MKNVLKENLAKQVVHWLLLVVLVLYLISGFGITEFRVVEQVTFGLLSKNVAFYIHNSLLIPFIVLLVLHIYQGAKGPTKK
jgi:cytochrome b subunit of formate dehydrogenase